MARTGHKIDVLKAEAVPHLKNSSWSDEINHENINVHEVKRALPIWFTHPTGGLRNKIKFHLYKKWMRIKEKGTIYDVSIGMEETILQKAKDVSQTLIENFFAQIEEPLKVKIHFSTIADKITKD